MIGAALEDLETDRFASVSTFAGFAGTLVHLTEPRVLLFQVICAGETDTQKKVKASSQEIFLNPFCSVSSFTSPSANVTFPSEQTTTLPSSCLHVPLSAWSGIGAGLVAAGFGVGAAVGFGAAGRAAGATRLGTAVGFEATERGATRFGGGRGTVASNGFGATE